GRDVGCGDGGTAGRGAGTPHSGGGTVPGQQFAGGGAIRPTPVADPHPMPAIRPTPAIEPAPSRVIEPHPMPAVRPSPVIEPAPMPAIGPAPSRVIEPHPMPAVRPAPSDRSAPRSQPQYFAPPATRMAPSGFHSAPAFHG